MNIRTMVAMLNDQIGIETNNQILNQFRKIGQKLMKFHPKLSLSSQYFENAFRQLKISSISSARILQMYTSEDYQLYILLNSFLRSMSCPTQIYYIQPLFKKLFEAVKSLYQFFPSTCFVCYRGGFISEEEFQKLQQATGELVLNLGFLSVSENLETAKNFKINILFEIKVSNWKQSKRGIPGFADISNYSQYFFEKQILFNPLNYFKVLEVRNSIFKQNEQQQSYSDYYMQLSYQDITKLSNQDQQEHEIIMTLLSLYDEMRDNIKYQRDTIFKVEDNSQFQIAQIFFSFFESKANDLLQIKSLAAVKKKEEKMQKHDQQTNPAIKLYYLQQLTIYLQAATKMGLIYNCFGRYEEALDYLQKSKQLYLEITGKKHLGYMEVLQNISFSFLKLNRLSEALNLAYECASLRKQILGEKHSEYINSLNNVAQILNALGRYEQALQNYQLCQSLAREVLGDKHPYYLKNISSYAKLLLLRFGKCEEALDLNRICAKIRKSILGERHPNYIFSLSNLANTLIELGNFEQAIQIYEQCAKRKLQILGEKHPSYFKSISNIALTLFEINRKQEALQMYQDLLQSLDETHPSYLRNVRNICYVLISLDRQSQALDMLKAKSIQKILSSKNPSHQQFYRYKVSLCLCLGEYQYLCNTLLQLPVSSIYRYFSTPEQLLLPLQRFCVIKKLLKTLIRYIRYIEIQKCKNDCEKIANLQGQIEQYQMILGHVKTLEKRKKMKATNAMGLLSFLL